MDTRQEGYLEYYDIQIEWASSQYYDSSETKIFSCLILGEVFLLLRHPINNGVMVVVVLCISLDVEHRLSAQSWSGVVCKHLDAFNNNKGAKGFCTPFDVTAVAHLFHS